MKTAKTISIIGLVIGLILILLSSSLIIFGKDTSDEVISAQDQETDTESTPATKKSIPVEQEDISNEYVLQESGWIPNWGFDLGFDSLKENTNVIDTVNPVLYTIDKSGRIVSRGVPGTKIESLVSFSKENSIRVIPTVGSYDYDSISASVLDINIRKTNIEYIMSEISKFGFDGIDLDYERISFERRDKYIIFLNELGKDLKMNNHILSVTVFPQWSNGTYHEEQYESIQSQDYEKIGYVADEVRIMTYDYTLQSSQVPGPISPISWVKQVLDFALRYIPKEKIWMGIPLYGYEWIGEKTVALTYTSVRNILNSPSINGVYRGDIAEGYAEFGCEGGQRCVLYYPDLEGIKARRDLAKEYGIAGVSYWRLGGEMNLLR